MVKGISRQVIVVQSPDKKLFEQAIFILKEDAENHGISDEMLLKEANKVVNSPKKQKIFGCGPLWACGGALLTGLVWLMTVLA